MSETMKMNKPRTTLFKQALKNMPFLKVASSITVIINIPALLGSHDLKLKCVALYLILLLSLFVLAFCFSSQLNRSDKYLRTIFYTLIAGLAVATMALTFSFTSYVFLRKPQFYDRYFQASNSDSSKTPLNDLSQNKDSSVMASPAIQIIEQHHTGSGDNVGRDKNVTNK